MVFSVQILDRLPAAILKHGLVAALLGAAALPGCGQKGPLFLPVPPQAPPPLATAPSLPQAPPAIVVPAPLARPASAPR